MSAYGRHVHEQPYLYDFLPKHADWRSLAHYESGPMSQSALKKIAALRRCGGLLSRLAYEHGRKEGADVDVFLQQARLTFRQIKDEDIQLGVQIK